MTKDVAVYRFKIEVLPEVLKQYDPDDEIAISEAWNDWTDALCKDGDITSHQYNTWACPDFSQRELLEASQAALRGESHF